MSPSPARVRLRPRKGADAALSTFPCPWTRTGSKTRRSVIAAVLMPVLFLVIGCGSDRALVWQTDAVSPDGGYTVHAETVQQSGPGNAWISTRVKLTQKGQNLGVDILGLSHDRLPRPPGYAVQIRWQGPRRLRLAWTPGSEVDLQAVRAIGVDIDAAAYRDN